MGLLVDKTPPVLPIGKRMIPAWASVLGYLGLAFIIYGLTFWLHILIEEKRPVNVYSKVANRDYSLFLWQNPQWMGNLKSKETLYVTGDWSAGKSFADPRLAEAYVTLPADILYIYNTWRTQVWQYLPPRPIPAGKFLRFLAICDMWQPRNWTEAPLDYNDLIEKLGSMNPLEDLQKQPLSILPHEVRLAFIGYENYFFEANQINALKPTYGDIQAFLKKYPQYGRSYWIKAIDGRYPKYLLSYSQAQYVPNEMVPDDELAPFLRAALYNDSVVTKPSS